MGQSWRVHDHILQIAFWTKFQRYDWGLRNTEKYKQADVPRYDISAIQNKKILVYGQLDNAQDALWLENPTSSGITNVVESYGVNLNREGFLLAREMGWL